MHKCMHIYIYKINIVFPSNNSGSSKIRFGTEQVVNQLAESITTVRNSCQFSEI